VSDQKKFDVADAVNLWNTTANECGWPVIRLMTVQRVSRLRNILGQHGEAGFREAIEKAAASDFLCGRSNPGRGHESWRFNIDLFLRPSFYVRLVEGAYDNKPEAGTAEAVPQTARMSDEEIQWRARLRGWRESRLWLPGWGPPPGQRGCMVPSRYLDN
jgi:hypothetical protein